jgi:hypothetical protein
MKLDMCGEREGERGCSEREKGKVTIDREGEKERGIEKERDEKIKREIIEEREKERKEERERER